MRLVCCLVLLLGGLQLACALLRVGAWNIETFGTTKAKDATIMGHIAKIVRLYDIIVIQELRDSKSLTVITALMDLLNPGGVQQYAYEVSDQLGPGNYTEQYLYVYRTNSVKVGKRHQYPDPDPRYDTFSRPPFYVEFYDIVGGVGNFVLIPQHTSPKKALKEIKALVVVEADVVKKWKIQKILILGDFNAARPYVTAKDWPNIDLFKNKYFHWLITNADDTTVRGRKCAYDRIVATDPMYQHVLSAQVYNFMNALNLTQPQALKVSNHYPVEVTLQYSVPAA